MRVFKDRQAKEQAVAKAAAAAPGEGAPAKLVGKKRPASAPGAPAAGGKKVTKKAAAATPA